MVGSRLCKIKITDRDRDGLSSAKIMRISVFNADLRDLNTLPHILSDIYGNAATIIPESMKNSAYKKFLERRDGSETPHSEPSAAFSFSHWYPNPRNPPHAHFLEYWQEWESQNKLTEWPYTG